MIMRWCNVQTDEYDLEAKTHPTIYTHHKLHNTNENKFPGFPGMYNNMIIICCYYRLSSRQCCVYIYICILYIYVYMYRNVTTNNHIEMQIYRLRIKLSPTAVRNTYRTNKIRSFRITYSNVMRCCIIIICMILGYMYNAINYGMQYIYIILQDLWLIHKL